MTMYTTKQEYIDQEITPALGEHVEDFDIDAIADDMLIRHNEHNEQGDILLAHSGYFEREDLDFWEIAEKHDTTLDHIGEINTEKDSGLTFEATPRDYLTVDEAHLYKNLQRTSKVEDISHPGSNRASDLEMKLNYLRDSRAERGQSETAPVETFATGTPVANNLAEGWEMARYLRPDLLEQAGSDRTNAWAAAFTETDTQKHPEAVEEGVASSADDAFSFVADQGLLDPARPTTNGQAEQSETNEVGSPEVRDENVGEDDSQQEL